MQVAKLPSGEPEIFYTLQGEGVQVGRPSVFLRLSLCNLHCRWCDTPYTWNWEATPWEHESGLKYQKKEQILTLSSEELSQKIRSYPCQNLVITGGEPLLQQKELGELLQHLPESWSVEIETNGTIIPHALASRENIAYNVSPKLPASGNPAHLALRADSLRWFAHYDTAYFKFVVTHKEDLSVIRELVAQHALPRSRVLLMPQGTDSKTLREESRSLVESCLAEGFRFSDRLHVHLWGNTRAT